jgi:uncharacterized protein YkwD
MTNEGAPAVTEAIEFIKDLNGEDHGFLEWREGLRLGCLDHVTDMGPDGLTGHYGTDGSSPFDRMNRYGEFITTAGENLAYASQPNGESYIMQLFVDDGVADRGHRTNIMKKDFGVTGVAIGPHKTYGYQVCLGYAGDFVDAV